MNKWMISALVVAVLASCTNPKQEKIEQLKSQAIEVHDEVMPRMGEIHDWSSKLKDIKKMVAGDSSDSAVAINDEIAHLVVMLDSADEAMMSWMHGYEVAYEKSNPEDSAIVYYEGQIKAISEVKMLMNSSIENAKQYVEVHQAK